MTILTPSLGFLLHDAARLLQRSFDRLAGDTGLTRAQFQLLAKVACSEGINQAKLADLLDMEPISVCRAIDRMEAGGWVVRKPDAKDRRAHLIYMTEAARPALELMQEVAFRLYAEMLADFDEHEKQQLMSLLTRLHGKMSETGTLTASPIMCHMLNTSTGLKR